MSACCFQGELTISQVQVVRAHAEESRASGTPGYFHKGTPKGSIIKLGPDGRETYVSGPEPAQASGAILIIADVFGISLNNNKIIAGMYGPDPLPLGSDTSLIMIS